MTKFLEAALRYAAEGYPVLPCRPGTKLPMTKRGFHDASTDPTQIREWWDKTPEANIAVVPGEGHSVVLDVDGKEGRDTLATLNLPDPGRIVTSPGKGGGFHYWYRLADSTGIVSNGRPWPGIDIRGHNGYVMVPPSVHPETGTSYAYAKDDELTVLPSAYLATTSAVDTEEYRSLLDIRNTIRRVKYKPDKDANGQLAFMIKEILTTPEGERHGAMVDDTWTLAQMVYSGALTHDLAMSYGEAYETSCAPHDVKDDFQSALMGAYRKLPAPDEGNLFLKLASEGKPRKARWAWHEKIPLGALTIFAGREGIGKSTVAFDVIARASRGKLEGDLKGQKKGTVIIATEDSWEEKILPSLMLTGADLTRIGYVASQNEDWFTDVVLPDDLDEIERMCDQVDAAFVLFDPLTSRLGKDIDTHKDSDVRRGLEPLAGFARKSGTSVIGIMHVNKGGGDPLNSIMGSKAFTAAARSVLFAARYDDDGQYGVSVIKSNSGPSNQGTDLYKLEVGVVVPAEDITGVRVTWGQWVGETMTDITRDTKDREKARTKTEEAVDWLRSFLTGKGEMDSKVIKVAAEAAGHTERPLREARGRLVVDIQEHYDPIKSTTWRLP